MIARAAHLVANQGEVRNIGEEAGGHFGDASATLPRLATIDDDAPILCVGLRVHDVVQGSRVAPRAIVTQKKTQRPVQFEITEQTRDAVATWITMAHLEPDQFLFPSRVSESPHLSTRQYSRIVGVWVGSIGLDPAAYGTHTLRRTKATLIYRRTRNLRAVQLLLGHTKLESTVRYLGIEVDDALEIAEQTEV
jgi:integrase